MTKIALTTAAILISISAAFAGSDKFGSNDASQPAVTSTDNTTTASIHNPDAAIRKPVTQGSNRDLFGSR
ncbi:hypothetical protein A9K65_006905 [Mesorhizobium sp. WSM1497]|uniref:DUF680 domain-containing protein n=1 Tax=unclassified Mesorhizobium TaxID=325217 RepID=UPI0007ED40F6|nr:MULTISPECIES: DUF680 domain-containing protein [unclassified Mesorhizobium]ARP63146.1 hypothetical protein A9K65_006905 [Mesorhizobium sp. WSM1497]MBZ9716907.1 DUF680 domain-containing protein [Mesorhizobium sp. AD1-1]